MRRLYDALVKEMKQVNYVEMKDAFRNIDYIDEVTHHRHYSGGVYGENLSFRIRQKGDIVHLHYVINMNSFYRQVPKRAFDNFVKALRKERDDYKQDIWETFKMVEAYNPDRPARPARKY